MNPVVHVFAVLLAFASGPAAAALVLGFFGSSDFAPFAGAILFFAVPGILLLAIEGRGIVALYVGVVLLLPAAIGAMLGLTAMGGNLGAEAVVVAALGYLAVIGVPAAIVVLVAAGLAAATRFASRCCRIGTER